MREMKIVATPKGFSPVKMKMSNTYSAKASENLYQGDFVLLDNHNNCYCLSWEVFETYLTEKDLYCALDTFVPKGRMATLAGYDTIYHIQGEEEE